jgi:hypothetical protein
MAKEKDNEIQKLGQKPNLYVQVDHRKKFPWTIENYSKLKKNVPIPDQISSMQLLNHSKFFLV